MIRIDRFLCIFQLLIISGIFLTFIDSEENKNTCWSSSTVYKISSLDKNNTNWEVNCTEVELVEECHLLFVQKITNITCSESTTGSPKQSSFAQKYGYGFLAVFIISVLSLAGFVAFPLMKKPYYKYLNAFFTSLAVGTLFSDIVFELLPVIIQSDSTSMHNHEHGQIISKEQSYGKIEVPLFLRQMTVLVITAYVFYVVELVIHAYMHHRHRRVKVCIDILIGTTSYDLNHHELPLAEMSVLPSKTLPESIRKESFISTNTLPNLIIEPGERQAKSTGWMIIIGDGIHNVADGLAIGAAFAESPIFGVTTSIAIACHELPTELGEYMVLIESGFTMRRALLFNFISACTAIIGFFIGASIAEDESVRTWIFSITAGTFAYIALVDLWPTMMPETEKFDWIRFICVTCGYLSGVIIMFILTVFGEGLVDSVKEN